MLNNDIRFECIDEKIGVMKEAEKLERLKYPFRFTGLKFTRIDKKAEPLVLYSTEEIIFEFINFLNKLIIGVDFESHYN